MERFNSRLVYVHEGLREFLRTLAALGGYCTVQQAMSLGIAGWDKGGTGTAEDARATAISPAGNQIPRGVSGDESDDSAVWAGFQHSP